MNTVVSHVDIKNTNRKPKKYSALYSKLSGDSEFDLDDETTLISLSAEDGQFGDEVSEGETEDQTYTVEDAIESIGFGWFQIRLYLVAEIFIISDAMEMLLLAVLSPSVRCEWGLEQFKVALISTVVFTGMGTMAPLWGYIGDKFGRQKTLIMVCCWIAYFGFLTTFTPSYWWILILRGLVGGGMAGTPQGFTLISEYLPSKYRAKLLVIAQVFWATGCLFEVTLAAFVIPTLGWRWLLALSSIPSILFIPLLYYLPESARFLMAAGQKLGALRILRKGALLNKTKLPEGELVQTFTGSQNRRARFGDLFVRQYLRATLQLWFMWFSVAFSYYGMVLAGAEILRANNINRGASCHCNLLTKENFISMVLSSLGEFACFPINLVLLDRFGRRITGFVNFLGSSIFFLLCQLHVSSNMLTIFIFATRAFSSSTFNYMYIYTSEVYPTTVRTLGIGTCSSWARVGAMATPFVAQVLMDKSVVFAVWVYGIVCFLSALCALFSPIETMGREMPQTVD